MKRLVFLIFFVLVVLYGALLAAPSLGTFVKKFLPSSGGEIPRPGQEANIPFTLPQGFAITVFTNDVPGARVMIHDEYGNFWVSQTKEGRISKLTLNEDGTAPAGVFFDGLDNPHGIAFGPDDPNLLYVAEEGAISRVRVDMQNARFEKIVSLPSGGGHFTRTIAFGPEDGRLYVSVGSSCNVCIEKDSHRAAILSMNKDGSDLTVHTKGLRNSVFFEWSYVDGRLWATENGRDRLGDDLPPDEVNIIVPEGNYGWPICYGRNVHDTEFDKNTYIRNPCMQPFEIPSHVDLQAHSAALGLAFVPEEGWLEAYWYDLIVAFHGSWNRSEPTGYKLARVPLTAQGVVEGPVEDFLTGLRTPEGEVIGRPVDVLAYSGGTMYVTDDHAGVIYKITYQGEI